jgi:polar amino acid transport system permease protein
MTGTRYAWDFSFLRGYRGLILTGLGVMVADTVGTILLGLVIDLMIGLLRLSGSVLITEPLVADVEIFRCTPLLVQIIWFYYAPVVLDIPANVAATLVLSLYTGAFYAEIIRGGVASIERGQWGPARDQDRPGKILEPPENPRARGLFARFHRFIGGFSAPP